MRARPVTVRFRRFYRRAALPPVAPLGAGGVYALDLGPWFHDLAVAELMRELGLE